MKAIVENVMYLLAVQKLVKQVKCVTTLILFITDRILNIKNEVNDFLLDIYQANVYIRLYNVFIKYFSY